MITDNKEMFQVSYVLKSDVINAFAHSDMFEKVREKVEAMEHDDINLLTGQLTGVYFESKFNEDLRLAFIEMFIED